MPPEDLRKQVGRLRALAPELNAVTDKASMLIHAVEHLLNEELQFSLPASAEMSSVYEERDGSEEKTLLEYARVDGKFKICISEEFVYPYGESYIRSRTVWASCARDLKLQSVNYVPRLLEDVSRTVERTINEGHQAAATVDKFLQEMEVER